MPLKRPVLILLAPVDLEVEELVAVLVIELTLRNTVTMIKVLLVKMFQGHSRIVRKPVSTFCRSRSPIETQLQTTCSLVTVVVGRHLLSEKIQVLRMRSIASHVEDNINSKTVPP